MNGFVRQSHVNVRFFGNHVRVSDGVECGVAIRVVVVIPRMLIHTVHEWSLADLTNTAFTCVVGNFVDDVAVKKSRDFWFCKW